jgi:hypothetical protein
MHLVAFLVVKRCNIKIAKEIHKLQRLSKCLLMTKINSRSGIISVIIAKENSAKVLCFLKFYFKLNLRIKTQEGFFHFKNYLNLD